MTVSIVGFSFRSHTEQGATLVLPSFGSDPALVALLVISAIAQLLYAALFIGRRGSTPGMLAVGIRAVDRTTGNLLGARRAWRRTLTAFALSGLALDVGALFDLGRATVSGVAVFLQLLGAVGFFLTYLWPLGNPLNQTLQDKAADSVVVRTR